MKLFKVEDRRTFEDARGLIDNLAEGVTIKSIARITGVSDAERGNHYHIHDEHYCYVESGEIHYFFENEIGKGDIVLKPGDMVYTPKMEKHRFVFLTEGVFYSFAILPRDHETYEAETVRIQF